MQVKFNPVKVNNYSYRKNNPNFCSKKQIRDTRKKTSYNPIALRALGVLSPEKLAVLALNEAQEVKINAKVILMKSRAAKILSDSTLNKSDEIQSLAQSIAFNSSSDYNYSLEIWHKKEQIQNQSEEIFADIADFLLAHSNDIHKLSSNNDEMTFPCDDGAIAIVRNKDKYIYEQYDKQGVLSKKAIVDTSSKDTPITVYDYEDSSIYEYTMKDNTPTLKTCSLGVRKEPQTEHIKEKYTFKDGDLQSYQQRLLKMPNHEYSNVYITYDNDKTTVAYDYNMQNGDITTSCASIFDKDELKVYADNYQIKKDGSTSSYQKFKFEDGALAQFDVGNEGKCTNGRYLYKNNELQSYCKIINDLKNKPQVSKSITFEDNKLDCYNEFSTKLSIKFKDGALQSATIGKDKEKYYFTDDTLNAYQKDITKTSIGKTMVFSDGNLTKYSLGTKINEDGSTKSNITLKFSDNELQSVIK